MSTARNDASKKAMEDNKQLGQNYYGIALPGMEQRFRGINTMLSRGGEPGYMKSAFGAQRAGLTEGAMASNQGGLQQQARGSEGATAGGNPYASMHPQQIGAQLANSLYGSRFQEGQSAIDESMNMMSQGLGGSGMAGSGALESAGNSLGMLGYMPNYNKTMAGVAGLGSLGFGMYGAMNQGQGSGQQPVPQAWSMQGVNNSTP